MITGRELDNRAVTPDDAALKADLDRVKHGPKKASASPDTDAEGLASRIAAARDLRPPREGSPHCGCCWGRGRDAAIRAIEGT